MYVIVVLSRTLQHSNATKLPTNNDMQVIFVEQCHVKVLPPQCRAHCQHGTGPVPARVRSHSIITGPVVGCRLAVAVTSYGPPKLRGS